MNWKYCRNVSLDTGHPRIALINAGNLTYFMLLSDELRNKVCNKIRNGVSINKISKELCLGKSTIYYYYKKIKGKKFVEPEFKPGNSRLEGEVNGIFAGDGSQYYDKKRGSYEVNVHFGVKNYPYAVYVKQLFENFFHKKFRLDFEYETKLRLRTRSRKIFNYFQNYLSYNCHIKHCTVKLKDHCSSAFKIGFLKGMFDTDGCLSFNRSEKRFRAVYYTTSKELARQINSILNELNIRNSIYVIDRKDRDEKTIYHVSVLGGSIHRFIKRIKPFKAQRADNSVR
jgi:hypothetical protein